MPEASLKFKTSYQRKRYRKQSHRTEVIPSAPTRSELLPPPAAAMIYRSELDYISRCILDYPSIETGGQLFGFWTGNGIPVVLFAIGPGAHANHSPAFFNQDVDYLLRVGNVLVHKYGLCHIGEWHSHHQLGLAHPSGHDAATMVNCIHRQNLGRFLLCIGTWRDGKSCLNAFNFTETAGYDYTAAGWLVKEGMSPFRMTLETDSELNRTVINPNTERANHSGVKLILPEEEGRLRIPVYAEGYWLRKKENNLVLKTIVDQVTQESAHGCKVQIDEAQQVHLEWIDLSGRRFHVVFPVGFPVRAPLVFVNGHRIEAIWHATDGIVDCFADYLRQIKAEANKHG